MELGNKVTANLIKVIPVTRLSVEVDTYQMGIEIAGHRSGIDDNDDDDDDDDNNNNNIKRKRRRNL
jgi:hypothetical protein